MWHDAYCAYWYWSVMRLLFHVITLAMFVISSVNYLHSVLFIVHRTNLVLGLIPFFLIELDKTSLNRNFYLARYLSPVFSILYNNSFGARLLSILITWSGHLSRTLVKYYFIDLQFIVCGILSFEISIHFILYICRSNP